MTTRLTAAELKRFRAFLDASIDRGEHGPSSDDANANTGTSCVRISGLTACPRASSTSINLLKTLSKASRGSAAGPGCDFARRTRDQGLRGTVQQSPSSAKKPATSSKKASKRKASSDDTAIKLSSMKPRSIKKLTASTLPSYGFAKLLEVNPNAPRVVRTAIAIVLHKTEEGGKTPWRLAYPWSGRPLRYDPADDRDVHREHGRFWITHRRAFWKWPSQIELSPVQSPKAENAGTSRSSVLHEPLNPEAIAKNRLSMTALARIRQDLTSGTKLKTS
ncbi:hypothetical protein L917_08775 [Phytophthora nicotianae]|uniref:Uncharacterized protein n=1 Tax=Phytophthora nicotianae TaxID=4792 RepID=W2L6B5_PHYNI|nr:hypothetical protein L917_08775 [Phytophthora nicotianae]